MAGSFIIVSTPLVSPSTAGSIVFHFPVASGGSMTDISAGDVVYLTETSEWSLVSTLSSGGGATVYNGSLPTQLRGVAVNSGFQRQPLTVCIADPQFQFGATSPTLSTGYAHGSAALGKFVRSDSLASTDYRVCVGVAISSTRMSLNLSATGQTA